MPPARIIREQSYEFAWLKRLVDSIIIVGLQYVTVIAFHDQWTQFHSIAAAATLMIFGLVAEYNGFYRFRSGERLWLELKQLALIWPVAMAFLLLSAYATKTSERSSRAVTFVWILATPLTLALFRYLLRNFILRLRGRGNVRTVAVVGCTPLAEQLVKAMEHDPRLGLESASIYDDRVEPRSPGGGDLASKVVGSINQLITDIRQDKISRVYLALPLRAEERVSDILHRLADTTATVYYVPDLSSFSLLRARLTSVGHIPAFSVFDSPFQGIDGSLKRAEDLVLGTVALLIAAIPMLAVAIAIKLTTRGPILFRQRRYGLGGKEIRVFKFRTMLVAEDSGKISQAKQNDQRVTPIGAILRRTSIDELPQLFNVLGGSMSLVGPRPHAVSHNEQYRAIVGNYMLRHKVKPGITGWAQVNGLRGETDVTEKMLKRVEYDLFYINNWSLIFDITIMWLTVFGRGTRKNAV